MGSVGENPEFTFGPSARQFPGGDKWCLEVEPSLQQDAWNAGKLCGAPAAPPFPSLWRTRCS